MKTLNELKQIIKGYFESHAQINSVYYCDDFDFNAERSIQYPVVNIEYLNSNINDKLMNHIFKVVIADNHYILIDTLSASWYQSIYNDCRK